MILKAYFKCLLLKLKALVLHCCYLLRFPCFVVWSSVASVRPYNANHTKVLLTAPPLSRELRLTRFFCICGLNNIISELLNWLGFLNHWVSGEGITVCRLRSNGQKRCVIGWFGQVDTYRWRIKLDVTLNPHEDKENDHKIRKKLHLMKRECQQEKVFRSLKSQ